MITGMHHAGVYCNDLEESLRFYEMIGFKLLFRTDAMEGDKPLKMAWVKIGTDAVFELIEQEDKSVVPAAGQTPSHIALRTDDIEAFAEMLKRHGVAIEAGPLDPPLAFDRPLSEEDAATFTTYGDGGAQLKIMFFRGPSFERFEVVQDNIAAL